MSSLLGQQLMASGKINELVESLVGEVQRLSESVKTVRGVIPTGAFEFHLEPAGYVVNPRCGNACRVVELAPGDEIRAFPKVRSHREAQEAKPFALRYDGREVTFTAIA